METDLERQAARLRSDIKNAANTLGAHYGSPLGAVELVLAVHQVFDSARDRIVFDTGHQAYAHKLLTSRSLERLRLKGGVSGFPDPKESEHDAFAVGHASTSIAACLGIERGLRGTGHWAIAVIGDAAFAGGLALEALNLINDEVELLGVILNDNSHSISPAVGSLERGAPTSYEKIASAMGIKYVGPVNGHDVDSLVGHLADLKLRGEPFLLHVLTLKGKGDPEAVERPVKFHALAPNRKPVSPARQQPQRTSAAAVSAWAQRSRARVISPGMFHAAGMGDLRDGPSHATWDFGIAEGAALTAAVALSSVSDSSVLYHIYSTFLQRAADQVMHDLSLNPTNLIMIVDRVGLSGPDGPTHHGVADLAILGTALGLTIYSVADEVTLFNALDAARESPGPTAIRMSKGPFALTPHPTGELSARTLRKGFDGVIFTHGRQAVEVLRAAEFLAIEGRSLEVVEVPRLCPLEIPEHMANRAAVSSCFIVEEHLYAGSLASTLIPKLLRAGCSHVHTRVVPNKLIDHGTVEDQLIAAELDATSIAEWIENELV